MIMPRAGGKQYFVQHRAAVSLLRHFLADWIYPFLQRHQEGASQAVLSVMETLGDKGFKATLRHLAPHLPVYFASFTGGSEALDPEQFADGNGANIEANQ